MPLKTLYLDATTSTSYVRLRFCEDTHDGFFSSPHEMIKHYWLTDTPLYSQVLHAISVLADNHSSDF